MGEPNTNPNLFSYPILSYCIISIKGRAPPKMDLQYRKWITCANTEPKQKKDIGNTGKILPFHMCAELLVFSPTIFHWSETKKILYK